MQTNATTCKRPEADFKDITNSLPSPTNTSRPTSWLLLTTPPLPPNRSFKDIGASLELNLKTLKNTLHVAKVIFALVEFNYKSTEISVPLFFEGLDPIIKIFKIWLRGSQECYGMRIFKIFDAWDFRFEKKQHNRNIFWVSLDSIWVILWIQSQE